MTATHVQSDRLDTLIEEESEVFVARQPRSRPPWRRRPECGL